MKHLILGGVKSGKSRYAEAQASVLSDKVVLVVTAHALDQEMAVRIARHQRDRLPTWQTIEAPVKLGETLRSIPQNEVVLIDCLTLWLTNLLMLPDKQQTAHELADFESAVNECTSSLILVSNETGMGIIPLGELTRNYCDEVGLLHQRLAQLCDRVELMVAGLPLVLK